MMLIVRPETRGVLLQGQRRTDSCISGRRGGRMVDFHVRGAAARLVAHSCHAGGGINGVIRSSTSASGSTTRESRLHTLRRSPYSSAAPRSDAVRASPGDRSARPRRGSARASRVRRAGLSGSGHRPGREGERSGAISFDLTATGTRSQVGPRFLTSQIEGGPEGLAVRIRWNRSMVQAARGSSGIERGQQEDRPRRGVDSAPRWSGFSPSRNISGPDGRGLHFGLERDEFCLPSTSPEKKKKKPSGIAQSVRGVAETSSRDFPSRFCGLTLEPTRVPAFGSRLR